MKLHDVTQGTPAWLALRASHHCASDAPVMMGDSKHTKRSELVRMKATGAEKEFSEWVQKSLLDKGHGVEESTRLIAEEIIGEELYPVTGSTDDDRYLASFDGLTMATRIGWENKLWNAELVAMMRRGELPARHYWQLEQQIMVGGLDKILFTCSDGTKEKCEHLWYQAVPGRAAQLVAAWDQFEDDVKNYTHVEVLPTPAARQIKNLPVLNVKLVGKVQSSNLTEYRDTALAFIRNINTDLQTDQDFADAENTVKFCGESEGKLEAVKEQALAQTSTIAELFGTLDGLKAEMRAKRLELEKLVEARKKTIRADILKGGQDAFLAHFATLTTRLGGLYMPPVPVDFATAMKGKRTIVSLRDAVDTELARAKIAANGIADKIQINLNALRDAGGDKGYSFLFSDLRAIVAKEPEDFTLLVQGRMSSHKAAEDARLAIERVRIQQEEATKATAAIQAAAASQSGPRAVTAVAETRIDSGQAVRFTAPGRVAPARPTDAQIITALAEHYGVHESRVVSWLMDMDFDAAIERASPEPLTAHQGA